MMMGFSKKVAGFFMVAALSACTTTGDNYRADVYKADQVNQAQEVKTVKLLAVMPARVEVDNSEAVKNAQIGGAILGAIAGGVLGAQAKNHTDGYVVGGAAAGGAAGAGVGSMVSSTTLVDGVSLTYTFEGKTLNSAQVGKVCEYTPGTAIMVSQDEGETRIQPNATCPKE